MEKRYLNLWKRFLNETALFSAGVELNPQTPESEKLINLNMTSGADISILGNQYVIYSWLKPFTARQAEIDATSIERSGLFDYAYIPGMRNMRYLHKERTGGVTWGNVWLNLQFEKNIARGLGADDLKLDPNSGTMYTRDPGLPKNTPNLMLWNFDDMSDVMIARDNLVEVDTSDSLIIIAKLKRSVAPLIIPNWKKSKDIYDLEPIP